MKKHCRLNHQKISFMLLKKMMQGEGRPNAPPSVKKLHLISWANSSIVGRVKRTDDIESNECLRSIRNNCPKKFNLLREVKTF